MEGSFKRFQAGDGDDGLLAMFDEGVPRLAEKALALDGWGRNVTSRRRSTSRSGTARRSSTGSSAESA